MITDLQEYINLLLELNFLEIIFNSNKDPRIEVIQNLKTDLLVIKNPRKLKCLIINSDFIATKLKRVLFKNCLYLKKIWLQNYKITDVEISDYPNLKDVNFFDNKLYNINKLLSILNPTIITSIWLNKNDFDSFLNLFEKFTKFEELGLSENKFRGSLKSLNKLRNLKILVFIDTHINSGLEFLDINLNQFYCDYNSDEYKVVKIKEKLKKYAKYDDKDQKNIVKDKVFKQKRLLTE
ncbi:15593_t:CDS:1 [Cetraspora pellucida]|uniref:15593_t:CDS:1 n=1 Tax=Cetraspora pellucida TaxID=1433469 RepID=A0ACA9N090_9GLOM|nr:15593_t:CDS:1 [Cetraspora pellucida]